MITPDEIQLIPGLIIAGLAWLTIGLLHLAGR